MNSPFFRLHTNDFIRGAITAVFAGVVTALYGAMSQTGFDIFSADWGLIINDVANVSTAAFVGYLFKNLSTNSNGQLFTREVE